MMSSTYDPADNKLRLYSSTRLDSETYARVKTAGFKWAPKQELFVAPMWTPEREDLLLELCGEIGDEDTNLVDRAEERAERFGEYSDKREEEAEQAYEGVKQIADAIPLGQPILVGHHSERHVRKDAERIENGMKKAVNLWETAKYWEQRAKGALRHAKYKERPDVRARRIKGLEADKRKQERTKAEAEHWLTLWSTDGLTQEKAIAIANRCWLHLPRKEGDTEDFSTPPTAYDALTNSHPSLYAPRTVEEVIDAAKNTYPALITHCDRWIAHYENRLAYEQAMLAESGGTIADKKGPEKGGACRCWASHGRWSYIQKVNKISVTILDNWGNGGKNFTRTIPFDKLSAVMTKAEVDEKRDAGLIFETDDKTGFILRSAPQDGTQEELSQESEEDHMEPTDEKKFADLRDTLKIGVQIISAPQLFPTPPDLAARMVELAEIREGEEVLEPSAGTGNICQAIQDAGGTVFAVEINPRLCEVLAQRITPPADAAQGICKNLLEGDFLEQNGNLGTYRTILMNPPFQHGDDIKHITHALTFLKPGGRLVALCANGPRQQEQLKPLATTWEELPRETFANQGTMVNAAMLTIDR